MCAYAEPISSLDTLKWHNSDQSVLWLSRACSLLDSTNISDHAISCAGRLPVHGTCTRPSQANQQILTCATLVQLLVINAVPPTKILYFRKVIHASGLNLYHFWSRRILQCQDTVIRGSWGTRCRVGSCSLICDLWAQSDTTTPQLCPAQSYGINCLKICSWADPIKWPPHCDR